MEQGETQLINAVEFAAARKTVMWKGIAIASLAIAVISMVWAILSNSGQTQADQLLFNSVKVASYRELVAEQLADSLRLEIKSNRAHSDSLRLLSLDLALKNDSIAKSHRNVSTRIYNSRGIALRALADSIRSGYQTNRSRYLVLLNTASPGND